MPRYKLCSDECDAGYHVMSRCIEGAPKLDLPAREMLRRMLWKVADFCGVDVVTYAIMPNHFHVLVRVPQKNPIADEELLRRYRLLHPTTTGFQTARIEVIADQLRRNTAEGVEWRARQLALMNDISGFMRLLKHRFTRWFNLTHQRFGTLWAERFKSVLVQLDRDTLRTVAAYIDLNPLRKGLVNDPKDYRFCGYAEALAGHRPARRGLHIVCPHHSWTKVHNHYRTLLYSVGASPRENKTCLDTASFQAVMAADGSLPLPIILRHRWRYLTAGTVLGQQAFIAEQRARLARLRPDLKLPPTPVPIPWGNLATFGRVNRTDPASD